MKSFMAPIWLTSFLEKDHASRTNAVLLAALDKLASTVVAVMVLLAAVHVTIFLYVDDLHRGHTSWMSLVCC
jgi:hypothetical protein